MNTDSVSKPHSASGSSTNMLESSPTLSTLSDTNGLDLQPEKKGIKRVLDCNYKQFYHKEQLPLCHSCTLD